MTVSDCSKIFLEKGKELHSLIIKELWSVKEAFKNLYEMSESLERYSLRLERTTKIVYNSSKLLVRIKMIYNNMQDIENLMKSISWSNQILVTQENKKLYSDIPVQPRELNQLQRETGSVLTLIEKTMETLRLLKIEVTKFNIESIVYIDNPNGYDVDSVELMKIIYKNSTDFLKKIEESESIINKSISEGDLCKIVRVDFLLKKDIDLLKNETKKI